MRNGLINTLKSFIGNKHPCMQSSIQINMIHNPTNSVSVTPRVLYYLRFLYSKVSTTGNMYFVQLHLLFMHSRSQTQIKIQKPIADLNQSVCL